MPTYAEVAAMANALADQRVAVDMVDWTGWSAIERHNTLFLALEILKARYTRPPQRRAMRLLRSWLPRAQAVELRRRRYFTVEGSAGGRYRIYPVLQTVHRVERHGTREYARESYCLHPDEWMPPADVSLGHYLLLVSDEPAFLAAANARPIGRDLWNSEYLRRLNSRRRTSGRAA